MPDPFSGIGSSQDPSGHNRKVTEPNIRPAPRMVMKVYIQSNCPFSSLTVSCSFT